VGGKHDKQWSAASSAEVRRSAEVQQFAVSRKRPSSAAPTHLFGHGSKSGVDSARLLLVALPHKLQREHFGRIPFQLLSHGVQRAAAACGRRAATEASSGANDQTLYLRNPDAFQMLLQFPLTNIRVARFQLLILNATEAGAKARVWPSRQRRAQRSSKSVEEVLQWGNTDGSVCIKQCLISDC
jgi:hypothetical protein